MRKKIVTIFIIALISSVSVLSAFNIYNSPWTLTAGQHVTEMDVRGTDWYLTHKDEPTPLYSNVGPIWKYLIYYNELYSETIKQPKVILAEIPSHFGYDQYDNMNRSINISGSGKVYMVTNEYMRQIPFASLEETQSNRKFYIQEDFYRLAIDNSVSKLYMNSERELWMVQSS